ncbi:hydrogenase [Pseudolysobacter antarcticus]|uniref:Hydrogenase n=2 Tax=Pseudolysobacter antarcticus TaxID=2511995 RepID=A0A411HQE2_9GAMM|nr:hydrogenase [Pseudolysobacter antarcticus]
MLGACATSPRDRIAVAAGKPMTDFLVSPTLATTHAADDDLLTAGLGLAGLRALAPPVFANPEKPTAAEVRRRAIWNNWRGIADLAPGGGFGDLYGSLPSVPGREFQALAKLPGANQPHRVLTQIPDDFDRKARCVVVAASSGSRGVYGAIALAGGWGLTHHCAVAYTDKGTGTGYVDIDTRSAVQLDGTRGVAGEPAEFAPTFTSAIPAHNVAIKHAHSGDNPEADWGSHILQAAQFALHTLDQALPSEAPFTFSNTRVIVLGVSNGAGAALRAAGIDHEHQLAGVVAVSPSVYSGDGRPLYDYVTEAAIFQPCALLHATFDHVALARPKGAKPATWAQRCKSLHDYGLVAAIDTTAQAGEAYSRMRENGWTDTAIEAGAISSSFDLWRAVAVTYASAYTRSGVEMMPCGYRFAALDASGVARASSVVEQATWSADGTGIPPSPGIGIIDSMANGADPSVLGLLCLRAMWDGEHALKRRLHAGVEATLAAPPRAGLPVIVIHGADDGLIPEAFTSAAYVRTAKQQSADRDLRYWRVANAQHFDAFLGLPVLGARYVPLMPYAYAAMDAMFAHLTQGTPLPASADIAALPRGLNAGVAPALSAKNLGAIPK